MQQAFEADFASLVPGQAFTRRNFIVTGVALVFASPSSR